MRRFDPALVTARVLWGPATGARAGCSSGRNRCSACAGIGVRRGPVHAGCPRPAWACPVEGLVSAGSPLLDQHALDLGGTYGVPEVGDPIQYDELRIEHDRGAVEIIVHNRTILCFTTDS